MKMKTHKFIYILLSAFVLLSMTISCSDDFLDQPAIGAYDNTVLASAGELDALLLSVYGQTTGTNNGFSGLLGGPQSAMLGGVRGGEALVGTDAGDGASWEFFPSWRIGSTTNFVPNVFTFYYNAVGMANQVMSILPNVDDMTDTEKEVMEAETRFLRAHFYFMLKRLWGNVPWIDESNGLDVKVPNTDENGNYVNIWPNIEADMQYAVDHLPETQDQVGRANVWAAKAYLVKILMEQKKYDQTTYDLCMDVVDNGVTSSGEAYGLMPNYHDNFEPSKENNKEGVFQCQISVGAVPSPGFMGITSVNYEDQWIYTTSGTGPGNGTGWGYYQPSQWYVDHFRVDVSGLPYLDYYDTNSESVKNDYGLTDDIAFTPETKSLDPRLDWIVGRRGVPFLDWGVMPGPSWCRDATGLYGGPYLQKKWYHMKANDGVDNYAGRPHNAINIHIIRFADVLLWAAELEARVSNDLVASAGYVDQVRTRMQNEDGWVLNEDGTAPAANYQIGLYGAFASQDEALTAILHERTLELGLEGGRFYDVVRFGSEYIQKELQDYAEFQGQYTTYMVGATFEVGVDEILPFSQTTIINSQVGGVPTIKQNPGYSN